MLPSGSAVEVLGTNPRPHSRIACRMQGRLHPHRRHLMEEAPRERVLELEAKLKELQQAPDQLTAKLAALQDEYGNLERAHAKLRSTKRELEAELIAVKRAAADPLAIAESATPAQAGGRPGASGRGAQARNARSSTTRASGGS